MRLSSARSSRRAVSAAVVPLLLAGALITGAAPAAAAARHAPSVSRIAPARGATFGGTRVTIVGRNFRQVRAVRFGTALGRNVRVLSPRKLRVIAPRHAPGRVAVRVITRSGGSRLTKRTRFTYMPPPTVGQVLPRKGFTAGGTAVTVIGRNFTAVRSVLFGAKRGASLHVLSPRKLRIVAPRHAAGSVDIRVVTAYGRSAAHSVDRFTYLAPPPPPPAVGTWAAPAPISATGTLPVDGLSCAPTAELCVAIEGASAVVYDGTAWSAPAQVADGGAVLTSVSCASATFCLATDNVGNGYTFDGTAWTSGLLIATSPDHLSSASCASATDCGVIDDQAGSVLLLHGSTWRDVGPNPNIVSQNPPQMVALSCGPAWCWVAYTDSTIALITLDAIDSTDGPWGNPTPTVDGFVPRSLGCFDTFCAVGGTGQTVVTRGNTGWVEGGLGTGTTDIDSVTCPMSGFCMAMDQAGGYAVYSDAAWSGLGVTGLSGLDWAGISCSSDTFCVAVDDQGTATVYTK